VVDETDAVFMTAPFSSVTWTTSVKGADAAAASVPVVQLTVPVPPTAGVEQLHPAGVLRETNVVPEGTASDSVTFWDGDGPLFAAVIA
jgi:hypothetical protein